MPVLTDTVDWRDLAQCVVSKVDPAIFDGQQAHQFGPVTYDERAFEICGACPVRAECLADAIQLGSTACIRGGLKPDEYKSLASA